jgi:hypothetical protein
VIENLSPVCASFDLVGVRRFLSADLGEVDTRMLRVSAEYWSAILSRWNRPTRLATLVLAVALLTLIIGGVAGRADASPKLFQFFGRICLVVYDLHGDRNYVLRDDMAARIASPLEEAAKAKNRFMRVRPRPECTQPHEEGVAQQLIMELYAKRQKVQVMGRELNLIVVGGSSPNGRDVLSEYELQPTILLQREQVSDRDIERALLEFVERNVISLIEK